MSSVFDLNLIAVSDRLHYDTLTTVLSVEHDGKHHNVNVQVGGIHDIFELQKLTRAISKLPELHTFLILLAETGTESQKQFAVNFLNYVETGEKNERYE